MMYRLFEAGEDMGLASEHAARLWLQQATALYEPEDGEPPRIEPVADDAPEFLPAPEGE